MADTSESLTSDDSGVQDNSEMSEKLPTYVKVPELKDSTVIVDQARDFYSEVQTVISLHNLDEDATEWILNNFHEWKTINSLEESEDLSVKKVRALKLALTDIFDSFVAQRQLIIYHFVSVGVEIEKIWSSPLIEKFAKGARVLSEFLSSDECTEYFPSSHVTCMLDTFEKLETGPSKEACPFENIRKILNECNLNEEAVIEVLSKIVIFDDLKACLDDCEELTKKQAKELLEKLGDIFEEMLETDLKTKADDHHHLFQDLDLPEEAVNWLNDWLKKADSSKIDLGDLDECEDLNKKQLKLVKDKLSVFLQQRTSTDDKLVDPRKNFLQNVREFLSNSDFLNDSIKLWIIKNIADFETLDQLEENEELTKRQVRTLKTGLVDAFTDYRYQIASSEETSMENCYSDLLQDLDLPEIAIEWITQWLKISSIDSKLDLGYLDECEDLNKKQLKIVKEKLTELIQKEGAKISGERGKLDPLGVLLGEIASQLKKRTDLDDSIKEWILSNVQSFQTLDELDANEELSKRQIRGLKADLSDAFTKYRELISLSQQVSIAKPNYSDLLLGLNLPQRAVDWINQWIESTSIGSNFDLDYLENCEELNKKQLKCVKEKLTSLWGLEASENSTEKMDPESRFLQEVALRLKQLSGLNESIEQWVMDNILNFKSLDDLNANEELNKRQIRELKANLLDVFENYQEQMMSEKIQSNQDFSRMFEGLGLSEKAIAWLTDWLKECKSAGVDLSCVENCEELNKRQQGLVKDKLKNFLQSDETDQGANADPQEIFLKNVVSFLKDQSDLDEPVREWIVNNITSFQSLDELECNEELNKRQIRELKLGLQRGFEAYCQQESSSEQQKSQEPNEVQDNVQETSAVKANLAREICKLDTNETVYEISITPLILFGTVLQEGFSIEKFVLSEEGVKSICASIPAELVGENPVLYNTVHGAPIIDFKALDQLKIECIGLFGPIRAIIQNLRQIISASKIAELEQILNTHKTGLYMLNLSASRKYLIFYCENDADFQFVTKDSKAVHFLRYMSQLTNNVVLCLDGRYEDRLAVKEETTTGDEFDRRSKYGLTKHEVQQESFSLQELGVKRVHFETFFSSESNLVAVNFEKIQSFVKTDRARKTGNVWDIKKILDVMRVEDLDNIVHEFKKEYLKAFEAEKWTETEEKINVEMQELLETREKEAQELIAMSVVVHFCNEVGLKLPLKMLEAFFAGNYTGSSADNLWSHLIKFNRYSTNNNEIAIYDVVKSEEQSKIKHKLSARTEESRILEKYVLWLALLEKEEGLPEDLALKGFQETSWEEVKNCAKKVFPARGFSVFAGGARDFTHIMEAVETKIDYANATEDLENCIQIYLSYLWENAEVFRKTNNFVAFCRKYTKSNLDKEKDSKLLVCAQQMFAAVMQQEGEETSENLGLIKSVQQSNYRIGKMFDCIYEKSLTEPSKTKIEIHAIAVSRNESQRLSANGGKLNIRELQFHRIAVLEISEHEKMVALIPLDKFVLLILNFERHAKTVVYSLANATKPCLSIPFGKTVASASFDCKARLLAIQPDMEPGIIHLFKFGEDYKSRQNLKSVDLNKMFLAESCVEFCLQPNSKFLWFLQEDRVRKIDYKNGSLVNKAIQLDNDMHNVKLSCTPDGGCLLAVDDESRTLPIMTDTGNLLEKTKTVSQGFQMFQTCSQMIATQCKESCMSVYQIIVTGAQHETKLNKEGGAQNDPYLPDNGKELQNEHWIDYIYWMFTKFPCDDLLVTNQLVLNFWFTGGTSIGQSFNQKLNLYVSSIWNKIRLTKKPTNFLNIRNSTITSKMSIIVDKMQIASDSLSWFMKKLITFIPVQIARCQSNAFIVLENGMPVSLDSVEDAFHLSEKINLSFYESIFSAWVGKIKVISSMGKQTTGKSFTLNHVTGSSFNISGARCTDGCWLTVKEQNDCLYVILDFEGLGTIERTEQDDMLLSLFNSSLSTITIFKTEKRIERDIDKLFSKMNMGSDQLKGTDKIFKGKFLIAINDVARQDVKDASKEFEEKISNIVSSSENNFIKKLYNSDFEIMALPAFESSNYYVSMSTLASIVQNEIKHVFESGSDFLSTLKLLMAKLATNDFTPLDRQQINERVRALRSYLAYAKTFGQISDHLPKKSEFDLKSFDDSNFSIALEKSIELPFVGSLILNDRDVVIENNQLDNFVLKFLILMELTPENCCDWREGLEAFVSESITFRFERINCWLEENLKKWKATDNPEYDDIINVVIENLESSKLTYLQTYKFCGEKCSQCFLKCTSIISHKGDHKCSTSHHCSALCDYCSEDANGCKMSFGHDGKHVCAEVSHVCCEPCKFKEVNNCTGECQKMTGHIDEHQCSEKRHPCIELCSLDGCEGRCVVNCDEEHTVHKCTKEECIIACCVPNCTNKCAALDHFHGSELSTIYSQEQQMQNEAPFLLDDGVTRFDSAEHFCGKEHSCGQDCDKDGFCYKIAEKQIGDKQQTFEGQRQTFTYDVVYVESGKKNQCPKKIKPFEKHHEGDHACSKTEHFCTVICPTCESICSKTVNHEQDGDLLHKVSHTNMLKCYLISEQEDIDVSEASGNVRKYKAGEEAKAEMCHVFCTAMGRGHVHIVECDSENPDACVYSAQNDGRRHQTRKYYPYPEQPKDEMKHDAYWALIGFEDPCQKTESDEFQKCPAHCAAEIHETNNEKIFCEMPLWHEPVKTLDEAGRTDGIITKEGHVFPCNHPSGFYHFVLCLDDSGSMGGDPWADLVSAVQTFVTQRIRTSTSDRLSIVIYNHVARTVAEYQLISNFTQSWLQYVCGGTDFAQGLLLADNIIGKHASKSVMPILIFMSDGQCGNGELEMGNIAAKYRVSSGLQVYTMGFGYADFSKLKELARVGYGQYLNAVSGMDLKALFVDISAKHPPTIGIAL